MKIAASLALLLWSVLASAADQEGSRPHPMFSRMQGYSVSSYQEQHFAAYEFNVGGGRKQAIEGAFLAVGYLREPGQPANSGLYVVRNHENAVKQMGGRIVAVVGSPGDPMYTTFKVERGGETTWGEIDTSAGGNDFMIRTVTVAAMEQEVTGKTLGEGLARDGKVALYGILFDTGKATLRPESDPTLAAIADMMGTAPGLSIYVVGHTDNIGSLAANTTLSEQRAAAVVKALVATHGVAASRMTAKGVGQLSPVAPNSTDEGRQKNRRVEIVAQ